MTSAFLQVLATEPGTPVCPYTLLERAYEETGAADSAFAVFRDGRLVHRSQRQQRRFNCPFQLNATGKGERVNKADVGQMAVRHGDVVVLGTDGLFDNMFDAELEVVVRMGMALGFSPKNMADVVAGIAYEMSTSKTRDSPYSADSRRLQGDHRRGGKPDDITVVVAFIVSLYS
uniref:Protein phosphatase n=1 Tax=Aegilops tauschii TaxID=37682 RepID=M8BU41_AEGTA